MLQKYLTSGLQQRQDQPIMEGRSSLLDAPVESVLLHQLMAVEEPGVEPAHVAV